MIKIEDKDFQIPLTIDIMEAFINNMAHEDEFLMGNETAKIVGMVPSPEGGIMVFCETYMERLH